MADTRSGPAQKASSPAHFAHPMRLDDDLRARMAEEPWHFDVLSLLRRLEAAHPDMPRLGKSVTLTQEIVVPRQDPFLEFPSCNVTRVQFNTDGPHDVHVQFMGYFGPQGALPLPLSAEAHRWMVQRNDPSFARFADIFAARFVQFFYRAWADARPVVQMDRREDDRFRAWLGALIGRGSPALRDRDSLPDDTRLGLTGLLNMRVRSIARLRQCLFHLLGTPITLEEHVGTWLEFDPADCSRLGRVASTLGRDICLGTRAFSLNDKLRLTLHCRDLAEYNAFLPGQPECRRLIDFLQSYLGPTLEVDIALSLPEYLAPPTRLGQAGQLGWTSFTLSPPPPDAPAPLAATLRPCAVFSASAH
ncbi:type VI secretion system baseplate subunit TssG [Roseinatronobacter alkalisoli]|uniref:Type VI secretion system baseplate subunit TssG n=1 Tax=Roseinatronobacter alkalisoli TaxID=3028235 RepID=A0ABT5TCK8_9RHOB|nr:type VI secretion system baseplate subunit TssG [Roseinatronobacter sp. HJB301]MDD7972868.1 type VI secretion system baseplate subunit TssG [Roseinatronobacter sp. HJB301]